MLANEVRLSVSAGSSRWWSFCQRVTFSLKTPTGAENPTGNHPSHTAKMSRNSSPSQNVGTDERT